MAASEAFNGQPVVIVAASSNRMSAHEKNSNADSLDDESDDDFYYYDEHDGDFHEEASHQAAKKSHLVDTGSAKLSPSVAAARAGTGRVTRVTSRTVSAGTTRSTSTAVPRTTTTGTTTGSAPAITTVPLSKALAPLGKAASEQLASALKARAAANAADKDEVHGQHNQLQLVVETVVPITGMQRPLIRLTPSGLQPRTQVEAAAAKVADVQTCVAPLQLAAAANTANVAAQTASEAATAARVAAFNAKLASLNAAGQTALRATQLLWLGVEKAQDALLAAKQAQDANKAALGKIVVKVLKKKKAKKMPPLLVAGLASLAAIPANVAAEQVNKVAMPLGTMRMSLP
jgi:hypothetical protein